MSRSQSRPSSHLKIVPVRSVDGSTIEPFSTPDPRTLEIDWSILMARAQDGDSHAYRRLLTAIAPYIRSLARPILENSADIEDSLQDVLITIHTIRATYDPKRPFGPWLKTVARRRIADKVRQNSRRRLQEAEFITDMQNITTELTPVHDDLDSDELETLIQQLPNRQAQALRLTKIEGLSLIAAATASGLTVGATKVAVHRAISRLRSVIRASRYHD